VLRENGFAEARPLPNGLMPRFFWRNFFSFLEKSPMGGSRSHAADPETLCAGRSKVEGRLVLTGRSMAKLVAPEVAAAASSLPCHGAYTA
jgi:hypothetical protein